mmetsp:Transcript_30615/g.31110  ORF Transcript_30615/g.31110 Transcript_30615/m.31110 type:complete len:117 (+) Transcript_30615:252-602(+)
MVFLKYTYKEWGIIISEWKQPFTMISSLTFTPTPNPESIKPERHTRSHDAHYGGAAPLVVITPMRYNPITKAMKRGTISFGPDAPPGLIACESALNEHEFIALLYYRSSMVRVPIF